MLVSPDTINRILIFSLYLLIAWTSFRRLLPELTLPAKRLATALLAAQVLVILWSLEWQPSSNFEHWLQLLTGEYNIPATLASVQLALVGCVALFIARAVKAGLLFQRLYFIGIGLIFLFFALDEYHKIHEQIANWTAYYAALGALVAMATVVYALYSPRRARKWQACFLAGLAISGAGAIGLELMPAVCDSIGPFYLSECLLFSSIEEALEFSGIWLALVSLLGQFSLITASPPRFTWHALSLAPILWLFPLLIISLIPALESKLVAQEASVQFQSGLSLHGYTLNTSQEVSRARLYASAKQGNGIRLGYSIHLIDQATGSSIAAADAWEYRRNGFWLFGPEYAPIYSQVIEVELPPRTPVNRAYWIALSVWEKTDDDYPRRAVLSSDLQLLGKTQVVLGELVMPADSAAAAQSAPLAEFDNGFALAAVDMPARAQAGDSLSLTFTWRSNVDNGEDYVQFPHLRHAESGEWFVYDQQPLGARLPTRLWYSGLIDSETWQAPLPAELAPGQYTVFTGLYRASDQVRLPARAANGERWLDGRVRLGTLEIVGSLP